MGRWPGPQHLTGMAAPMAVWALHLLAVYSLQGLACAEDWQRTRVAGLEAVTWWLLALTVAALAAIAWLGARARRAWRLETTAAADDVPARRRRFTAAATTILAVIAAVAVTYTAVPILLLTTCD
ncbi:hypothetical protein [Luteimonas suaedae]|uniref:hypothetical protein n=1 Tax=Luteimonas suaedae TaxID=2605430 RepID=UPI0011EFBF64|nr:hypothetical protein [Luteimonas suaedae]